MIRVQLLNTASFKLTHHFLHQCLRNQFLLATHRLLPLESPASIFAVNKRRDLASPEYVVDEDRVLDDRLGTSIEVNDAGLSTLEYRDLRPKSPFSKLLISLVFPS